MSLAGAFCGSISAISLALAFCAPCSAEELKPIAPIQRVLPPKGIEIPPQDAQRLREKLGALKAQVPQSENVRRLESGDWADAEVFLKAVEFALDNGEFYKPDDIRTADALLAEAQRRIEALQQGRTPWAEQTGLVVRGFISEIDGTAQPYGVEVPGSWAGHLKKDLRREHSCYLWLHGRGDAATDMHFIHERMTKRGQFQNENGVVVHPFGRHCLGYKSAGEVDVLEVLLAAQKQYPFDLERVALMGFSMGGAGAWHLGAHYAGMWAAVHAGAGFVDVKRYQNIDPSSRPSWEVKLWGLYDVSAYCRNFLNVPLIAYGGELDKQKASADIMEEELRKEGIELRRVIGKGVGHKYTPEAIQEIKTFVDDAIRQPRRSPRQLSWQTRTLRYFNSSSLILGSSAVHVSRLGEHWQDARVNASFEPDVNISTSNVRSLTLKRERFPFREGLPFIIDGSRLEMPRNLGAIDLVFDGKWQLGRPPQRVGKCPGLQGPIDDAFMGPFLVVTPSGTCRHPMVERWVQFELAHFEKRWREVFRGRLRMKKDVDVTSDDLIAFNLILWGDTASNGLIGRFASHLPIKFGRADIEIGEQKFVADRHVPIFMFPKPEELLKAEPANWFGGSSGYIVINSGPTFREAHDKTNSQQNPKLPDWAVIDLTQDPDAAAAGRVAAAGFFNEEWQL